MDRHAATLSWVSEVPKVHTMVSGDPSGWLAESDLPCFRGQSCRQAPPAITLPEPGTLAADSAVGTVTTDTDTVSMINSQTCNSADHHGCTPTPPTATVGAFPQWIAVDQRTHTVYVANAGSGTTGSVSVFDARTCNASHSVGCAQAPQPVTVGFSAFALAVNTVTNTIYVANFADSTDPFGGNTVSVIDGVTCNATDTTGCANAPQHPRPGLHHSRRRDHRPGHRHDLRGRPGER